MYTYILPTVVLKPAYTVQEVSTAVVPILMTTLVLMPAYVVKEVSSAFMNYNLHMLLTF